ncbi:MAG: hypothetical protein JXB44_13285 [Calditrichaceae bacterium]|nr:hypothetical protein [Calditrichaceae bacterium]
MKKFKTTINLICIWFMLCFFIRPLPAQGYGGALTFQGLDNITLHSASSRAAGGVSICAEQDAGLMFQNPATLHSINSIQLSIGGLHYSKSAKQEQNYAPVRYYPNLSLLLEGLTASIPDPDTALFGFTARDTVQRPFDGIGPNWSKSDKDNLPVQIMLAAPVKVSENIKIIAGVGAVEYANLDHYYQNNNVLSPSILSQRPLPTLRPTDDDPLGVDWYQTIRSRDGSINGYGFALTGSFEKYNLSIGISGMILEGNSDDY